MTKLSDLTPDSRNANKGTARGQKMIVASIAEDGFGRSILLDKNGRIIAGNKSAEASAEVLGVDAEVVVVETDGNKVVAVKRTDLDLDDLSARRLAYRDNLASAFSFELDPDVVMADIEGGFNFEAIDIHLPDLGILLNGGNDPEAEWEGMPEFEQEDQSAYCTIKIHFGNQQAVDDFSKLIGQTITDKTRWLWYPKQKRQNLAELEYTNESEVSDIRAVQGSVGIKANGQGT